MVELNYGVKRYKEYYLHKNTANLHKSYSSAIKRTKLKMYLDTSKNVYILVQVTFMDLYIQV